MRYLSLFSGIEAVSVAACGLNWEAVAFSEIAEFPSTVLKHHFPNVPNLGDVRNIKGDSYNGTVEIIIGGSPCQDFSISGNRTGLYGSRSSLAREYIRLLDEIRPRWFLWENVAGAFSTNGGKDFRALLSEMEKYGYGMAWRVLDAQYFGVPQRRRRIFLVGYLGDWRPPAAVLFEPKSLLGNFEKSGKKEYCSARTVPDCPKKENGIGDTQYIYIYDIQQRSDVLRQCNIIPTLTSRMGTGGNNIPLISYASQDYVNWKISNVGATLRSSGGILGGGSENLVSVNDVLRKLTPIECERLQGFPDKWTDVPYRGKEHSPKAKRYEALGNAIAVPVLKWIFNRMDIVENLLKHIEKK